MATRTRVKQDEPQQQAAEPALHVKYRPQKLADVLGQKAVVDSLQKTMKAKSRPQTFLFSGPAGTGKTTLARILAHDFGCTGAGVIEVDAASTSGVDDMRALTTGLRYKGFGENPAKAIILDECHRLSKNAWDSLLKITEEPPPDVFFFFCSTEPDKVPKAMTTRCQAYNLAPVKVGVLLDLLEDVCKSEGFDTAPRILELVADAAQGSPRAALTGLSKVYDCEDEDEALRLLEAAGENAQVIEFCRLMCWGKPEWRDVTDLLEALPEQPAESIRLMIVNYVAAVLAKPKNSRDVPRLLDVLHAFSKPCNPSEKMAPLLLACGSLMFD